ncbi:hypothetical protein DFH09DRAFT_1367148 [Mycena vulgaris]|nr:hypothetical protein DFH09DRAFT_1367148 [Mycena vulgaris]
MNSEISDASLFAAAGCRRTVQAENEYRNIVDDYWAALTKRTAAPYALSLQINERSSDAGTPLVTSKQPLGPWLGRYLARGLHGFAYPLLHSPASPSTNVRPLSSAMGASSACVEGRLRRHLEPPLYPPPPTLSPSSSLSSRPPSHDRTVLLGSRTPGRGRNACADARTLEVIWRVD